MLELFTNPLTSIVIKIHQIRDIRSDLREKQTNKQKNLRKTLAGDAFGHHISLSSRIFFYYSGKKWKREEVTLLWSGKAGGLQAFSTAGLSARR